MTLGLHHSGIAHGYIHILGRLSDLYFIILYLDKSKQLKLEKKKNKFVFTLAPWFSNYCRGHDWIENITMVCSDTVLLQ